MTSKGESLNDVDMPGNVGEVVSDALDNVAGNNEHDDAVVHVKTDVVTVSDFMDISVWVMREGPAVEGNTVSATGLLHDLSKCAGELVSHLDFSLLGLVFDFNCCRKRARRGKGTGSARFFFTSPQSRGFTKQCEAFLPSVAVAVSFNDVTSFSFMDASVLPLLEFNLKSVVSKHVFGVHVFLNKSVAFMSDTVLAITGPSASETFFTSAVALSCFGLCLASISSWSTAVIEMLSILLSVDAGFSLSAGRLQMFICWSSPL